jgi:hypothetical protein
MIKVLFTDNAMWSLKVIDVSPFLPMANVKQFKLINTVRVWLQSMM